MEINYITMYGLDNINEYKTFLSSSLKKIDLGFILRKFIY